MRGLTTYEAEKRREKISPLQRMEAPGRACFPRICDFASSIKSDEEPTSFTSGGNEADLVIAVDT
jgi:hypothetical protein